MWNKAPGRSHVSALSFSFCLCHPAPAFYRLYPKVCVLIKVLQRNFSTFSVYMINIKKKILLNLGFLCCLRLYIFMYLSPSVQPGILISRFAASNIFFRAPFACLITIIWRGLTIVLYYFQDILLDAVFSKYTNIVCTSFKTIFQGHHFFLLLIGPFSLS